ncbi:NmrA-like family protein [Aspergillus steynii IBT 23096]|uniref:NmrA-like family protein n=1 Tax=Aspergillus steynii IBT 23096 TaxID=1392250 RepID=A0A2I2GDH3_9EURO|nr:NmrA-like family protein [Aspergillus steynii IBT 23096]PLB50922.1 NmrA-like family protein [Aspergillus steynii IBT 23096]
MSITVGIAGITGKFARRVASHLLKNPDVSIRGYCRDPNKVPESISSSDKVTLFKGDAFDNDAIRTFVQGSDVLICCYLGDDKLMVDGQKILIDTCEEVGDPMIHVRAHLASKEKVKGVHILIGGFMEPVLSPFFSILDASSHTFRFWGNGDEIMEGTTYDNAAEFTSAVARDTEVTGIIRFLGGRSTIREIAQTYENVYGVKAKLESLGSLDDLYKTMHDKRASNPADFYSYMSLFFYYYWVNGQTFVGPELDNEKYPEVKPVSWEDYMKQWPLEQLPTSYFALNA